MEQRLRTLVENLREKAINAILHKENLVNESRTIEVVVLVSKTISEADKFWDRNVVWVALEGPVKVYRRDYGRNWVEVVYYNDLFSHFKPDLTILD